MQEFTQVYNQNAKDINNFLKQTMQNLGNINNLQQNNFKKLFNVFPSLELVYLCEKKSFIQTSPNIYRNKINDSVLGRDRSYLKEKINLNEENISISQPYFSSATEHICITVVIFKGDSIFFFDFKLSGLLERLGFVERHKQFNFVTKAFYFFSSATMMMLAIFTIGYSAIEFIDSVLFKSGISIDSVFKPIIALTLGLAVFDLGKTVMAQEVFFKSYSKNSKLENRVLTKFSVTIIIALLIESLMVVFKIALEDYSQMQSAFYLISGVSVLIISLAIFTYLSKK
jgi:hypothetical protein